MAKAYQVLKNGVPVCLCFDEGEAEDAYTKYNADEIRELEIDDCTTQY